MYFRLDEFYQQGHEYLHSFYRDYSGQPAVGCADVHLMYFPYVMDRIHEYNPQMRFIAVLRNPIDRAYSAYWFEKRDVKDSAKTFEQAIDLEQQRLNGSHFEQCLTYLSHGHYAEQLERFIERFGRERLKVVLTENLRHDPPGTLSEVLDFLGAGGLPPQFDPQDIRNVAAQPKSRWLQRLLTWPGFWFKRIFRRITPPGLRASLRSKIIEPLVARNVKPFRYPPMNPQTRKKLIDYYRPHNERLEKLLGLNLNWDE
jgi:hypothetical protein